MGKRIVEYIKYTQNELEEFVNNPNSYVRRIDHTIHIGLSPSAMKDFKKAITDVITNRIGRFDDELKGIILDVRNIKVIGSKYCIFSDRPEIHCNVKANFYVFQPEIDATIRGTVKHVSQGNVSVLIYRVFNVSIKFKGTPPKFVVNSEISFKIIHFDLEDCMPFIEGNLIESSDLEEDSDDETIKQVIIKKENISESESSGTCGSSNLDIEHKIKKEKETTPKRILSTNRKQSKIKDTSTFGSPLLSSTIIEKKKKHKDKKLSFKKQQEMLIKNFLK